MSAFTRFLQLAAQADRLGVMVARIGLIVVLLWIGGLKAFKYEADGIVPFVANSPVMSFFYKRPSPEYKAYMNPEGKLVPENREWHHKNGTYLFSYGLGAVIVLCGLLLCLHPWRPEFACVGSAGCPLWVTQSADFPTSVGEDDWSSRMPS